MTTEIVASDTANLPMLADKINQEHRLCEQSMREGLAHAINAGNLLIEAKSLCPHGTWGEWLQANCEVSERTAQAYMRVARGLPMLEAKAQHVADLNFRDAVKLLAEPEPEPTPDSLSDDERAEFERCEKIIGDYLTSLRTSKFPPDYSNPLEVATWAEQRMNYIPTLHFKTLLEYANEYTAVMLCCKRAAGMVLHAAQREELNDLMRAGLDALVRLLVPGTAGNGRQCQSERTRIKPR